MSIWFIITLQNVKYDKNTKMKSKGMTKKRNGVNRLVSIPAPETIRTRPAERVQGSEGHFLPEGPASETPPPWGTAPSLGDCGDRRPLLWSLLMES